MQNRIERQLGNRKEIKCEKTLRAIYIYIKVCEVIEKLRIAFDEIQEQ